ncbi:MAG: HAMP domain-containing histidine kinase, partial [Deltaproteobacteria bacterium]|nr:HAMP domain-containing histidine kinase [Deltaproteobacteria bacterium]
EAERKEAERAIALERESTEAAMAGGFAHEMRNALSGGNLLLMGSLGLESKEAANSIPQKTRETLVSIHKMVSGWGISKEQITELGGALRAINKNEKNIEHVLNSVHGATERALMITKQIMQYSKMGHSLKGMERVSVSELIAAVMDDSEVDFGSGHVGLLIDVPEDLVVQGDNLQYYSIIKNLVQNARDAVFERFGGDEGGRVGLIIESHENFWRVVVSDNGVGIPEEHRPKIFKAFFSTKPETGTGLGLGMVKKLVNLYNGTISVDSVVGEGTTFTLDFQFLSEDENGSVEQAEGASLGDAEESVDG